MAVNLMKGQKVDLTKGNPALRNLLVGLGWDTNKYYGGADFDLDASVFLLGANGRVRSNLDFVYYGNLRHNSGSVEHMGDNLTGGGSGDAEQIRVNLANVPSDVEKITVAVTIYDAENRRQNFGQVSNAYIRIVDEATHNEVIRYDLGEDFSIETSVVVGEIYRYKGEWKFTAIGSGFKGGLKTMCLNYGVDMEIRDPSRGVIELKKGQKVDLIKRGASMGEIMINLNWSQPAPTRGFFGTRVRGIDLDLGCLYELYNGKKGAVQALGNSFGSLCNAPYIALDGDDRTGTSADGENLRINGAMVSQIKRVLVYTYIYKGAANWEDAKGVVTVKCPGNQDIIVRMDEYGSSQIMCAIALLENKNGESFSIEKIVRFFNGHKEMDRAFNWGMRWVAGHK
ncbi:MAG: tellurium resistance protein TerA [Lachnospiraceae bacterium]|nr:tellurium resistance protein TerA [Lachnospiraceae bacterium]